jgi:hypothetical protein
MSSLLERTINLVFSDHKTSSPPRPAPPRPRRHPPVLTRAEVAQCTCPDACERDHEND